MRRRKRKRNWIEYDVVPEKLIWGIGNFYLLVGGDKTRGDSTKDDMLTPAK